MLSLIFNFSCKRIFLLFHKKTELNVHWNDKLKVFHQLSLSLSLFKGWKFLIFKQKRHKMRVLEITDITDNNGACNLTTWKSIACIQSSISIFTHSLSFYFISLTFRIHLKLSVWCKQLMNIPKATSICKSTWLIFEIENTVRESENYSPCRLLKSALSISTTNIQWVNANCHTNAMNDFSNIRWELENGLKFKNKNL